MTLCEVPSGGAGGGKEATLIKGGEGGLGKVGLLGGGAQLSTAHI